MADSEPGFPVQAVSVEISKDAQGQGESAEADSSAGHARSGPPSAAGRRKEDPSLCGRE